MTSENLKIWFTHHAPVGDQAERYEMIRLAGYVRRREAEGSRRRLTEQDR